MGCALQTQFLAHEFIFGKASLMESFLKKVLTHLVSSYIISSYPETTVSHTFLILNLKFMLKCL